jgi:transposase
MKYTQNERIMQITEKTLIVGIDVGSEKHYARAFNFRGVEYGKLLIFDNNAEGFAKLREWAEQLTF